MLIIKTKSQSLKDFIYLFMFAAIIKLCSFYLLLQTVLRLFLKVIFLVNKSLLVSWWYQEWRGTFNLKF